MLPRKVLSMEMVAPNIFTIFTEELSQPLQQGGFPPPPPPAQHLKSLKGAPHQIQDVHSLFFNIIIHVTNSEFNLKEKSSKTVKYPPPPQKKKKVFLNSSPKKKEYTKHITNQLTSANVAASICAGFFLSTNLTPL